MVSFSLRKGKQMSRVTPVELLNWALGQVIQTQPPSEYNNSCVLFWSDAELAIKWKDDSREKAFQVFSCHQLI